MQTHFILFAYRSAMNFFIYLLAIVCYGQNLANAQYYRFKRPPLPTSPIRFPGQEFRGQKLAPNSWKMLDYNFPSETAREQALANGHLVPENAIPIDVQPHYYGKNNNLIITKPSIKNKKINLIHKYLNISFARLSINKIRSIFYTKTPALAVCTIALNLIVCSKSATWKSIWE